MIVKTIGRGQDNNIVVNDENVSRIHLQMVQDDDGNISVVDLGSTNGTFVNGSRITSETRLRPGDEVQIGDTKLPWQQYFRGTHGPVSTIHSTHTQSNQRQVRWLYVICGVMLVLFVVFGVLMYVKSKNESKVRTELEKKEQQLKRERDAAGEEINEIRDRTGRQISILETTIEELTKVTEGKGGKTGNYVKSKENEKNGINGVETPVPDSGADVDTSKSPNPSSGEVDGNPSKSPNPSSGEVDGNPKTQDSDPNAQQSGESNPKDIEQVSTGVKNSSNDSSPNGSKEERQQKQTPKKKK